MPQPANNVLRYRRTQALLITNEVGVYALCDLDQVPIYVGQSVDGIRSRVRRHFTSARSDIIANRMIDVWEIAYVWAWPIQGADKIRRLEAFLFHQFHDQSPLMNGTIPVKPTGALGFPLPAKQAVQLMPDDEIETRREPTYRLPRQAEHFVRLVDHILNVKDSKLLRRSLVAHFDRLTKYYDTFLKV